MDRMFNRATSFNQDLTDWCVQKIPAEPIQFSYASSLSQSNHPLWGTCPP
jgi:hypothetical protein